ncbi:branched-chain amino acid ABC transporter permease [Nesterenkonia ebinurensis]|uniref:branched-chain amino acid ABC transporter permease n=1 Tax=Nesterenkonia ebinurensis TaxID=2608252 RepID=UPI00123D5AD9|nr:branched-chain amino acid ABC transporter permease [Nesterenkonia ebinurensis]
MTTFAQAILSGTAQGAIYALLALGFVIIYKATHVISFAQPALMVIGGLFSYHFSAVFGLPFWPSLFIAILLGAGLGMLIERLALRPMIGKPVFTLAIITIGVDVVLRVLANRYIGADSRALRYPGGSERYEFLGLALSHRQVTIIVVTLITVVSLALFIRYAKAGLAMRATALDQETALAQGVKVGAMFALAWAIAGGLAAIAGTFIATGSGGIEQDTWIIALKALPAIIIGGLDSLQGAVIGGLAVGIIEQITAVYQAAYLPFLGTNFSLVAPYALMFVVLLIRPYGLFGTKEVERV